MEDEKQSVEGTLPETKFSVKPFVRMCSGFMMTLTQLVIAAYLGSLVGANFSAATTLKDCQEVGTAKVGESYIKCDVLPKKKDPASTPPR